MTPERRCRPSPRQGRRCDGRSMSLPRRNVGCRSQLRFELAQLSLPQTMASFRTGSSWRYCIPIATVSPERAQLKAQPWRTPLSWVPLIQPTRSQCGHLATTTGESAQTWSPTRRSRAGAGDPDTFRSRWIRNSSVAIHLTGSVGETSLAGRCRGKSLPENGPMLLHMPSCLHWLHGGSQSGWHLRRG